MEKNEIDFIKNKIKEIKEDYKKRYIEILNEFWNIENNDPYNDLYKDLYDRFGDISRKEKLQICLCLKNIHTGEFFNKFFDHSTVDPKKFSTPPLFYIVAELNKLEDYELYISCNLYKGCKNPRRTKENVLATRYLYVDIDNVRGAENLDVNSDDYNNQLLELFYENYEIANYITPTKIIGSGAGLHLYFYLKSFKTAIYFDDKIREEYINILRQLAINFEGDLNCVDISRVLRLPNTFNKKTKFDKPKRVELLQYNYTGDYTLKGLKELLDNYNKEHKTKNEDFWIPYELESDEELPFKDDIIEPKLIMKNNYNNKYIKTNKKANNKKNDDYFNLSNYEINENFPNQYLIQDLLYYIKNRDGYCRGTRRNLLFVFYFCFKQYIGMSYSQSCEYVFKVNQLFQEPLYNNEVEELLNYLKDYDLRNGFRNIKILELFKFKSEEIQCMRGTYSNNQEEKRTIKLERDRRIIKSKYIKTKTDRNIIIDYIKNNPEKSDIEISNIFNMNRSTIYRYRKSLNF